MIPQLFITNLISVPESIVGYDSTIDLTNKANLMVLS